MLDQIVGLVKNQAMEQLMGSADVPDAQAEELAGAAGESIVDGLQGELANGNIEGLTSLLGGQAGNLASNPIVGSMISSFAGKLTGSAGVSSGGASSLASGMIPSLLQMVIGKFTSTDQADAGFDLNALVAGAGQQMLMDKAKDLLGGGGLGNLLG